MGLGFDWAAELMQPDKPIAKVITRHIPGVCHLRVRYGAFLTALVQHAERNRSGASGAAAAEGIPGYLQHHASDG